MVTAAAFARYISLSSTPYAAGGSPTASRRRRRRFRQITIRGALPVRGSIAAEGLR